MLLAATSLQMTQCRLFSRVDLRHMLTLLQASFTVDMQVLRSGHTVCSQAACRAVCGAAQPQAQQKHGLLQVCLVQEMEVAC